MNRTNFDSDIHNITLKASDKKKVLTINVKRHLLLSVWYCNPAIGGWDQLGYTHGLSAIHILIQAVDYM